MASYRDMTNHYATCVVSGDKLYWFNEEGDVVLVTRGVSLLEGWPENAVIQ